MENKSNAVKKRNPRVQSVFRAANILSCIGNRTNMMTDIAEKCKLSYSTVHRLLKALEDSNLVIQDPGSHKYYFGNLVIKLLTNIQIPHEYLVILAREEMNRLVEVTGETISLAVLIGQQFHSLYEVSGSHKLKIMEAISYTYEPLSERSSASQVLLAQIEENELLTRLKNIKLQSNSGKEYKELLDRIGQVRKQGYAVSLDEVIPGCVSISAPISNYLFPTVLSIFGPKDRMKPTSEKYINSICESARCISAELVDKFKDNKRLGVQSTVF